MKISGQNLMCLMFGIFLVYLQWDLLGASVVRESTFQAGDMGLIPEWGRFLGGVNGNLLQYSWPGKSHGQRSLAGCIQEVTKSRTLLRDKTSAAEIPWEG